MTKGMCIGCSREDIARRGGDDCCGYKTFPEESSTSMWTSALEEQHDAQSAKETYDNAK